MTLPSPSFLFLAAFIQPKKAFESACDAIRSDGAGGGGGTSEVQNTRQIQASPSLGNARVTPMWTQCISPLRRRGGGEADKSRKVALAFAFGGCRKGERNFPKEGEEESCSSHTFALQKCDFGSIGKALPPCSSCRSRSTGKQEWGRNVAKGTFPSPIRENHGWTQTSLRIFRINRFPISLCSSVDFPKGPLSPLPPGSP